MKTRISTLLPPILLFLLTFALFAPSIGYILVNLDDPVFIVNNPIVFNGFSWHSLGRAFTALHGDRTMYTPLLWISYLLDSLLFRATPFHPWGFHFTNVLFHAFNALLLWLILLHVVRRPWLVFFVAAFWAFHPLRVESVAWVTERKDTLSTLFAFASILCYLKAWEGGHTSRGGAGPTSPPLAKPSNGLVAASFLFFLLGLLSKPMLVTLPFLFLLLDYWPLHRFSLRDAPRALLQLALEKWPFFLLVPIASMLTYRFQGDAIAPIPIADRLLWIPVNYLFYFTRSFWPVGLCPLAPGIPATYPWFFAACLLFLALTILAVRFARRCPGVPVGLLAFAGLLFPVCGIVHIGSVPVADRYSYLPSIGLCLAILALLDTLCPVPCGGSTPSPSLPQKPDSARPSPRAAFSLFSLLCGGTALAALAGVSLFILPAWKNNESFALRAEKIAPDHSLSLLNRFTDALYVEADATTALAVADAIWKREPSTYVSTDLKILALSQAESSSAAIEFFEKHPVLATRIKDGRTTLSLILAILYADVGKFEQASTHLAVALEDTARNPKFAESVHAIAFWIYAIQGRTDRAADFARLVPSMDADHPLATENFFLPLTAIWNYALRRQTLPRFLQLARDASGNPALLNNIAWLLATAPNSPAPSGEILTFARQAHASLPGNLVLQDTLAVALAFDGRFDEALAVEIPVANALRGSSATDAPAFLANVEKRIALFRNRTPFTENADIKLLFFSP